MAKCVCQFDCRNNFAQETLLMCVCIVHNTLLNASKKQFALTGKNKTSIQHMVLLILFKFLKFSHYRNSTLMIKQAGWFLRPNCAPRSECPQFGMPAERRAQFQVPNVHRSRISESAPFRIYEHAHCRVFERTSLLCAYVIPCQQQIGSSAVLQLRCSALVLAASTWCLRRAHSIGW